MSKKLLGLSIYLLNKKYFIIILSLLFIFALSRFMYLDSDLPPWNIAYYQPIDEFYYTLQAFNFFNYGVWWYTPYDFLTNFTYFESELENIMTFFSLETFGNNYYGLRGASVISVIMIVLMITYLVGAFAVKDDKYKLIIITMIYMIVDFSFNLSGRIAEPTVFRMLALVLIIFVGNKYLKGNITQKKSFSFGFLAFSSFIFVYLTNAFIVPAVGMSILLISLKENRGVALRNSGFFILGTLISLIIFLIFHYTLYNENFFSAYNEIQKLFSARTSISHLNIFDTILSFGKSFFQTNIFMYNLSLLFIFLFSLPLYIFMTFIKKKNLDILILSLFIMLFLQSLYINDYPQRKLIILFPLVLLIIVRVLSERDLLFSLLKNNKFKTIYTLLIGIGFWYIIKDIEKINIIFSTLNIILSLVSLLIFLDILSQKNIRTIVLLIFMTSISVTNIYLNYTYIYSEPQYTYKNIMIDIGRKVGKEQVAGCYSHAFRLYNEIEPLLNSYCYEYIKDKEKIIEDTRRLEKEYNLTYILGCDSECTNTYYNLSVSSGKLCWLRTPDSFGYPID